MRSVQGGIVEAHLSLALFHVIWNIYEYIESVDTEVPVFKIEKSGQSYLAAMM